MNETRRLISLIFVLLLFVFLFAGTAAAPSSAEPGTHDTAGNDNPETLSDFYDTFFSDRMAKHHVPGAAVAIVQDGRIVFTGGYGYADIEQMTPVDAERTPFRVASVSKALTIAAVLQLYESGQINLDDEVNRYIGWRLENHFSEPVRVRHLLTHSDGFGTRDINTFSLTPEDLRPLGELLREELTPPVKKPGTAVVYGSFGTALAGHLVERVTDRFFEEYMAANFFEPLGMKRSSFAQVLPADMAEDAAVIYSYEEKENRYIPYPYLYLQTPPTGGLTTTAADMGSFLLALLNGGAPILKEETVASMLTPQFSMHPELGGVTYGFMEQKIGGETVLIRDGSGLGICSQLCLLPEHGAGYFYVQNAGGDALLNEFNEAFLAQFIPQPASPAADSIPVDRSRYEGVYRAAAANEYTIVKFLEYLFTGNLQVSAAEDGRMTITPLGLGDYLGGFEGTSNWLAVDPLLFREAERERYVAFVQDESGEINALASGSGYHSVYDKLSWPETPQVQLALLILFMLAFLSALPAAPLWLRRQAAGIQAERIAGRLVFGVSLLNITGFFGVVYILLIRRVAGFPAFGAGIPEAAMVLLALLLIAAALGLLLLPCTLLIWKNRGRSLPLRLYYTLMTVASLGFTLWLNYWNLLGFRF